MPDVPLDQYGTIPWKDEKARLDQLFIQLQHWEHLIGYIVVVDPINGCPGEAQARAIRAKRHLVEYRGVANNRLIWKVGGYRDQLMTTLLVAPPESFWITGVGLRFQGKLAQ